MNTGLKLVTVHLDLVDIWLEVEGGGHHLVVYRTQELSNILMLTSILMLAGNLMLADNLSQTNSLVLSQTYSLMLTLRAAWFWNQNNKLDLIRLKRT